MTDAIEARTQEIGRELFALARREHAHLSVLNRWTAQVLSWCLADPKLKGNVLRFIDVLPTLRTPRAIARHVVEYFPTADHRLPAALRVGSTLAGSGLLTAPAVAAMVTQSVEQLAHQFIAESHPEAVGRVVQQLAARNATCSLDILGEQVLSEAEADRYAAQCEALLEALIATCRRLEHKPVTCGPRANLSVKPSALTPRFDPISPTSSVEQALARLLPICQLADAQGALITLDMEQYELRDLTLELAKQLLVHPRVGRRAELGVVIQAYLRDSEAVVEALLGWLAAHERPLMVRLVKGAYWDAEVARAAHSRWPVPVFQDKAATDAAFERLTERLLRAHPLVRTAIASHNVRSIAHAMATAEALGLAKEQLEFQLLYGMGDALQAAITACGYPVRIYTPIGELIPGMAYLVRRILENTANESFLRQEFLQERNADELLRTPSPASHPHPPVDQGLWRGESYLDFSQADVRRQMTDAVAAVRRSADARYPLLLGDRTETGAETLTVRNPTNPQETLGTVAQAGLLEVNHAVKLANATSTAWVRTPVRERVACLRRAAQLMRQRRYLLSAWQLLEVGKTWREADADVVEAVDYLEYYSQCMLELVDGKPLLQVPGEHNELRYVPRGVAVVIAPWNFPAAILTGMSAAALVTGHPVILKPSEQSAIIATHIAHIYREAGIPPAVVQCLPGRGIEVGASLVRHAGTHLILFTGSKAVGLSILQACARLTEGQWSLKHVVTEMGGKNAIIVDEDADLDAAVAGTLQSAFGYGGQKCSAASRVIVHEAVYSRFVDRLASATDRLVVGDPVNPATDVGPLIEENAAQRLQNAIAQAREIGTVIYQYPSARLPQRGYFVGPTLVADIPPQHPIARQELFGPLVCLFRVKRFDDALALANDTEYALTGGVFARSPSHITEAIEAFDVGNLYINRHITGAVVGRQPFGGHRLSGLGTKAGGPDYLLHLVLPKTICTNTARHGMPLE
jgi:RHH-type proline utilization regulon transcriptional repressor/proline dehydrogenase/delta 1-pyrroline-5-carboxylate dehydrogenase